MDWYLKRPQRTHFFVRSIRNGRHFTFLQLRRATPEICPVYPLTVRRFYTVEVVSDRQGERRTIIVLNKSSR
jgi:hypothetical protein